MWVGPLPLLPSSLLAVQLQRHGNFRLRSPRPSVLVLGLGPWGTRFPPVYLTPLVPCLAVGGWEDIPPTPFLSEVGVMGVGAWVGMRMGVVGVYGPMSGTPVPFPVQALTNWRWSGGAPSLGVHQHGVVGGLWEDSPCSSNFDRGPPLWGMACVKWVTNLARGPHLGGKVCGLGGVLVNSLHIGSQLVVIYISPPPGCAGWEAAMVLPMLGGGPFLPPPMNK